MQKHAWEGTSDEVHRHTVGDEELLTISDLQGLIALVKAGALEIHPWGSTIRQVEKPDRIVFNLDPDEGLRWSAVVEGAEEVRARLQALELESFLKTSGGKGLHVVVPIAPRNDWATVKAFVKGLVEAIASDSPSRYTASLSKRARSGRIFIDYVRNGRGATAVAAYSTRARLGAPVSVPLDWNELSTGLRPNHFAVQNLPSRLQHLGQNPWADITRLKQRLAARP